MTPDLQVRTTPGAQVTEYAAGMWRLSIPGGPGGCYRWAQLDDYLHRPRSAFRWQSPLRMSVRARVSDIDLPGTWGFGLWNDPFNVSLGLGGMSRRLPALPNAVWFFHAAPPNALALRDTHPAQGLLAATFASRGVPAPLLALGAPVLPLLGFPPTARLLRRLARRLIEEDAARLEIDPTAWHTYGFAWQADAVTFSLDGAACFATDVAPRGRLGLVLWIDNQYAAFPAEGRLRMGTSPNAPAWLELAQVEVEARAPDGNCA
jgi:hypothetical protein